MRRTPAWDVYVCDRGNASGARRAGDASFYRSRPDGNQAALLHDSGGGFGFCVGGAGTFIQRSSASADFGGCTFVVPLIWICERAGDFGRGCFFASALSLP